MKDLCEETNLGCCEWHTTRDAERGYDAGECSETRSTAVSRRKSKGTAQDLLKACLLVKINKGTALNPPPPPLPCLLSEDYY